MQARRLPAARGTFWLVEGFRLFRRHPPLITALTLGYLLVVQVFTLLLPGIGPILLPLMLPALTLIVANGCRAVAERRIPNKMALLQGLIGPRSNAPAMLRLGLLQLSGAVLLVLANMLINGGMDPFARLEEPPGTAPMGEDGTPDAAVEAAMLGALLKLLLIATPLIMAFWFTPFLVGWDRVPPVKAVFFSTVACLRNWRAMSMFCLGVIALAGIVPGFILIAVSHLAGMALNVAFLTLRMLLVFLVAPVLTASIYVSYRDIFQQSGNDA